MSSLNSLSTFQQTPFGQLILTSSRTSSTSNSSTSPISLNSNLDQLIRDELNEVSLCSRSLNKREQPISVGRFLNQRSYGNRTPLLSSDYGLQHLISNNLLKEDQIDLGEVDKVYSSCWLNDDFVICGTKCNKLILINLNNQKHYYPPVVESRNAGTNCNKSGGLYSISTNPSRTLLATGTKNGNDIAIYRLPSLDILFLLENGHNDFIFDIVWLDDHFLVSGSRDSNISLWKVDEEDIELDAESNLYKMKCLNPIDKFSYYDVEKIRCLNFNRKKHELGVLSFNAKLHLIDASTMKQKLCIDLIQKEDLVCLTRNDSLYAVGSKSHVQLIDSRTLKPVSTIVSKEPQCGIRSLSFNSKILTVGTGIGSILFYDIRSAKYFNNQINQDLIVLKTSKGWIQRTPQDHALYGHFSQLDTPAIYTHQYDQTKTRLFTAGGPLVSNCRGNYAALWS